MVIIKAYSYDYKLKRLFTGDEGTVKGKIHSVFDKAVNVNLTGRLITFFTSEFNQPGAVIIDKVPRDIEPGNDFSAGGQGVFLGKHSLNFSFACPWRESFPKGGLGLSEFRVRRKAAVKKISGPQYQKLLKYFYGKNIKEIVGLGEGLTPAGDDFLLGALNSAFYEKKMFPCVTIGKIWKELSRVVRKHMKRTNDISISFFKYALNGRISERSMNLLNSIYNNGSSEEITSAIDAVFKWGATSGRHHLLGLCYGVRSLGKRGRFWF